jgi:glycosyltransferase involved in cell wall biosynthesis
VARIALVHDVAGVAKVQAELLRTAGHEVDQIELPDLGASWRWPAKSVALPFRFAAYLPTINRLRRGRYDVIHIHWLTHGIAGALSGRPFFVQAHGSDLHLNLGNPVYRRITASVLERAKTVFYVTPNLRAFLNSYEDKLVYLPNPVDLRGVAVGSSLAPREVGKVMIFTRLDPVKGVDRIFPAVEQLSRSVQLTAFDWGPLAREYVRRYRDFVRFVKPIPHGEIGTFLQQFDLVIGQMRQGILSLMEIEALAAGRPLVTALDSTLYEQDPPPVMAASDPDAILAVVEKVRNDPDLLAKLSTDGRAWALRNHSFAHHLELLESAYFGTAREPIRG